MNIITYHVSKSETEQFIKAVETFPAEKIKIVNVRTVERMNIFILNCLEIRDLIVLGMEFEKEKSK